MKNVIFDIKGLVGAYSGGSPVLKVDNLQIPRGGLNFILGSSGIGKSTLLEILGLMNDPYFANPQILKYFLPNGEEISIEQLWESSDDLRSSFRKGQYSFIFQNTNLMPNFSAGENMAYPLILEGKSWLESKNKVLEIMPSLGLNTDLFDRPVQLLSGGQRQRCAFVRAFVSTFEVIFGDEPTGNLDPLSARNIMSVLKKFVNENNKSAILVSHDIRLAIEYADRIYYISRNQQSDTLQFGVLNNDQVFNRQGLDWLHSGSPVLGELEVVLNNYL